MEALTIWRNRHPAIPAMTSWVPSRSQGFDSNYTILLYLSNKTRTIEASDQLKSTSLAPDDGEVGGCGDLLQTRDLSGGETAKPTFRSEPQGFFQHFRKWKSKTLKTCRDVLHRSPTSIVYTHIFQRIPSSSEIIGSCHGSCHDFCIRAKFGKTARCHVS